MSSKKDAVDFAVIARQRETLNVCASYFVLFWYSTRLNLKEISPFYQLIKIFKKVDPKFWDIKRIILNVFQRAQRNPSRFA